MADERELTAEGKRMWDNITSILNPPPPPKKPKLKVNPYEVELDAIRLEIKRVIKNSELVIEDCDAIIEACKTMEEYLSKDARVAKTLHTNLIARLTRILSGQSAFDYEIFIDEEPEETNNVFFVDTFKGR